MGLATDMCTGLWPRKVRGRGRLRGRLSKQAYVMIVSAKVEGNFAEGARKAEGPFEVMWLCYMLYRLKQQSMMSMGISGLS